MSLRNNLIIGMTIALAVGVPASAADCPPCSLIGYVYVQTPTIDPPLPAVGQDVTITFPINAYTAYGDFSCQSCTFWSTEGRFTNISSPMPAAGPGDHIVVHAKVASLGHTQLRLLGDTATESMCYADTGHGCDFYFITDTIHWASGYFDLEVGTSGPSPVPTNTPTRTPTATPTATPTETPIDTPSETFTETPIDTPSETSSETPTVVPTDTPPPNPTSSATPTVGTPGPARISLAGRVRARVTNRPGRSRAKIQIDTDDLPLDFSPRCGDAPTWVVLVTNNGDTGTIGLPCEHWMAKPNGYLYRDREAGAGGVRQVMIKRDKLVIDLRGPGFEGLPGPTDALQIYFAVGDRAFCSRLENFAFNDADHLTGRGLSLPCD